MKKKKFEDYENLDKLINVCLSKVDGSFTGSWQDVSNILGGGFAPEALARFGKYIAIYRDNQLTKDESIEKVIELQKERRKLCDQRRELNRSITELARMEGLFDMFDEHLKNRERVVAFDKGVLVTHVNKKREALVYLSDIHYGIKVNNELNKYDTETCKESFRKLYNDTKSMLKLYETNKLTILLGGDLVSGIIHTNLRLQQEEDVIDQVLAVGDLIEEMATNFKALGVEVSIVGTIGNHSRVMQDKQQNLSSENFERIIFRQLERAGFNILQESDVAVFDVANNPVVALHGHQTSPQKAFTYCVKRKKVIPSTILMAHYHNDMRVDDGCPVIVNGSMVGTDEHALEFGYCSQPHQKIMIFEEGKGEICTFKSIFDNRI